MNLDKLFNTTDENPFDNMVTDGGFCGIFRTIGCIGDSLSSGEFESLDADGKKDYHDYFDYSWGQYMARSIGCTVRNFSKGGMTAKVYWESFAEENDYWNPEKLCQAYIIALGVNDISQNGSNLGSVSDIDLKNYENTKNSFVGYYARIIQRIKSMQPKARFFLMTIPRGRSEVGDERFKSEELHAKLIYDLAELFDYTYVLDFRKYAPVYDDEFKKKFYLGGHMNPAGYILTAQMASSYIDYIIRHNMEDFAQIGFVGTPYHNSGAKW